MYQGKVRNISCLLHSRVTSIEHTEHICKMEREREEVRDPGIRHGASYVRRGSLDGWMATPNKSSGPVAVGRSSVTVKRDVRVHHFSSRELDRPNDGGGSSLD